MSRLNRSSVLIWPALSALGVMLAFSGCGPKRGPAVATQGPNPAYTTGAQDLNAGNDGDIRSIGSEGTSGEDLYGGEGGPMQDALFAFNDFSLSEEARGVLERDAAWLQAHRATSVMVEGHCDERGTVEYNLALGERRANAARDYLVSLGVDGSRLTVVSYGKERPVDPGHTEAAWARNRRVHLAVRR
jgi:peptidoglycan-associated lipoprotein